MTAVLQLCNALQQTGPGTMPGSAAARGGGGGAQPGANGRFARCCAAALANLSKCDGGEAQMVTDVIHSNVVGTMQALVEACDAYGFDVARADARAALAAAADADAALTPELGAHVAALWADAGVQAAWAIRHKLQVVEAVSYFFEPAKLTEICAPGYPADADERRRRRG